MRAKNQIAQEIIQNWMPILSKFYQLLIQGYPSLQTQILAEINSLTQTPSDITLVFNTLSRICNIVFGISKEKNQRQQLNKKSDNNLARMNELNQTKENLQNLEYQFPELNKKQREIRQFMSHMIRYCSEEIDQFINQYKKKQQKSLETIEEKRYRQFERTGQIKIDFGQKQGNYTNKLKPNTDKQNSPLFITPIPYKIQISPTFFQEKISQDSAFKPVQQNSFNNSIIRNQNFTLNLQNSQPPSISQSKVNIEQMGQQSANQRSSQNSSTFFQFASNFRQQLQSSIRQSPQHHQNLSYSERQNAMNFNNSMGTSIIGQVRRNEQIAQKRKEYQKSLNQFFTKHRFNKPFLTKCPEDDFFSLENLYKMTLSFHPYLAQPSFLKSLEQKQNQYKCQYTKLLEYYPSRKNTRQFVYKEVVFDEQCQQFGIPEELHCSKEDLPILPINISIYPRLNNLKLFTSQELQRIANVKFYSKFGMIKFYEPINLKSKNIGELILLQKNRIGLKYVQWRRLNCQLILYKYKDYAHKKKSEKQMIKRNIQQIAEQKNMRIVNFCELSGDLTLVYL